MHGKRFRHFLLLYAVYIVGYGISKEEGVVHCRHL